MNTMREVVLILQIASSGFAISFAVYCGKQIVHQARLRGTIDADELVAALVASVMLLANLGGIWAITRIP